MLFDDVVDSAVRNSGREDELRFWRDWLSGDGKSLSPRAAMWCDVVPNPELQVEICILLRALAARFHRPPMRVLDIGSGPISILSRCFDGLPVEIVAADPLADDYEELWPDDPIHRERACRPIRAEGERLSERLGINTFDVTHIRNAIDHTAHPMQTLAEMIKVTRPGGFLIVYGMEDEATHEGWAGFHQWNMRLGPEGPQLRGKERSHYPFAIFAKELQLIHAWRSPLPKFPDRAWCSFVAIHSH